MFHLLSLPGWMMEIIAEDSYGLSKGQAKSSDLYQTPLCAPWQDRAFNYLTYETLHTPGNPKIATY